MKKLIIAIILITAAFVLITIKLPKTELETKEQKFTAKAVSDNSKAVQSEINKLISDKYQAPSIAKAALPVTVKITVTDDDTFYLSVTENQITETEKTEDYDLEIILDTAVLLYLLENDSINRMKEMEENFEIKTNSIKGRIARTAIKGYL